MGCKNSKLEESKLIGRCRERKNLMKTVLHNRHAFASAHLEYTKALCSVGEAIRQFVLNDLSVATSSSSSTFSPQPSPPKPKFRSGVAGSPIMPEGSQAKFQKEEESREESKEEKGVDPSCRSSSLRRISGDPTKSCDGDAASAVHQSPVPRYGYGYNPYCGNGGYYGVTADHWLMSFIGFDDQKNNNSPKQSSVPPSTPPPPPPQQESSGWDFLSTFSPYDQVYSTRCNRVGSIASSINSTDVRQKEGIPELEDVLEVEDDDYVDAMTHPSESKQSKVEELKKGDGCCSTDISKLVGNAKEGEEGSRKKSAAFDVETSLMTEESGPSIRTALYVQGTRDIRPVAEEIKEQFMVAADSGRDLGQFLEGGKLQRCSNNTLSGLIYSKVSESLSTLVYSLPPFKLGALAQTSILRMIKDGYRDYEEICTDETINESSVVEKLYVWEAKLLNEVKNEENLRIAYDQKYKQLNKLLKGRTEAQKIESTRSSIEELLTEIEISVKSIKAISVQIQKLRDEDLQYHLVELIQRLVEMWNSLLDCHRNQYKAIVETKTNNITSKIGSVAKATLLLKLEILNWLSCFIDWMDTQRSYVEALNAWLMMFINEKPEETADGVFPFSPGRLGAPPVFLICNDWAHAMKVVKRNLEEEMKNTMQASAETMDELWKVKNLEYQHKLREDSLSRDYERTLNSLQKKTSRTRSFLDSLRKIDRITSTGNDRSSFDEQLKALDLLRARLNEVKENHAEIVKQVHEQASRSLRTTLIPIFEALGNFILEIMKVYEGLRLPPSVLGEYQSQR